MRRLPATRVWSFLSKLCVSSVRRAKLCRQLVGELGQLLAAPADELELPLDDRNR